MIRMANVLTDKEMVSLREFFIHVMNEKEKRYDQRFEAQEKALKVALDAMEKKNAGMGQMWTFLISVVAIVVSVGNAIMRAIHL